MRTICAILLGQLGGLSAGARLEGGGKHGTLGNAVSTGTVDRGCALLQGIHAALEVESDECNQPLLLLEQSYTAIPQSSLIVWSVGWHRKTLVQSVCPQGNLQRLLDVYL